MRAPTPGRWPSARQGFTLVELVIVVAIIAIVSSMGWGHLTKTLARSRTKRAALDFLAAVNKARGMAISDQKEFRICLMDSDPAPSTAGTNVGEYWVQGGNKDSKSTRWDTLPLDYDVHGSDQADAEGKVILTHGGEDELKDVSIAPFSSTLSGPDHGSSAPSNQDCMVFSPQGWLTNPNGDFGSDGYITWTFVNKAAVAEGRYETYTVKVSRSGFARVDFNLVPRYSSVSGNPMGIDQSSASLNRSSGS